MYFCYIDDSGDSKKGTTMSVIMVEDKHWSGLLASWIQGRRKVHSDWGLAKNTEIHAVKLLKGRGEFCETQEQNAKFADKNLRAAAGRILLSNLANFEHFQVLSFGMTTTRNHELYAKVIAYLEDWAIAEDTYVLVFYDGLQGFKHLLEEEDVDPQRAKDQWTSAARNAAAYRSVHRNLDISERRIVEDVVMQDSMYNQLIQAADLVAYCSYHKHLQNHPEIWGTRNKALEGAAIAYSRLSKHWRDDSDHGMIWFS